MYSRIFPILLFVTLAGCASTKNVPMHTETARDLAGHTIAVAHRDLPDFMLMTATKAAFMGGLVGSISAFADGNAVVRLNNIQDPAYRIADESVDFLTKRHGVVLVPHDGRMVDGEATEDIANLYGDVDYVIDSRTLGWMVSYLPLDWNNYIVRYSASLRVIDTKKKLSVAEGLCSRETDKEKAPSYAELFNSSAAGLKRELENLSDQCVDQFLEKTLVTQAGG